MHTEKHGEGTQLPNLHSQEPFISLSIQVVAPKWLCGPNTATSVCPPPS